MTRTPQFPPGTIAVIGMAGRFPGSKNTDEYWHNLHAGREMISQFSKQELLSAGIPLSVLQDPDYVRARGVLDGIELLDAEFFRLTDTEAAIMAPEHRLLLECAWEALESAGQPFAGQRVGVFAGTGFNSYFHRNVLPGRGLARGAHLAQMLLANEKDHAATRIAYKLDLRGPCVSVQTACSTSLVAIHLACQSLSNGECDMALAGGATITVPQKCGYQYQDGGIMSPDGHCRAFDAKSRGSVSGNGAALVLLKRAEEAFADRDPIHALVLGTAINNDGADKVGYTAPSVSGQAAVIAEALAVADVDPGTIGYIETHGTGTALGDPVEIKALAQSYKTSKSKWTCAIGSVKTSIGHLDTAAGAAGFIKAVMALKYGALPASLHFETPNPEIGFSGTPFFVNRELRPWRANGGPRRAAVSSFGIGGTNAHVILEQPPAARPVASRRPHQLLVLSAKNEHALNDARKNLGRFFEKNHDEPLADVAYTLQTGRRAFPYRSALVCADSASATSALLSSSVQACNPVVETRMPSVVFLFPGQGAQYVDMGRQLYETEGTFRSCVDQCANILKDQLKLDLRSILYPEPAQREEAARQLDQTRITQPALFLIEYALAQLWAEWGVRPRAMIGHSIGEYVAACIAGVFSLEDALMLVAQRGQLMQEMAPGAMLSVSLGAEELSTLMTDDLSLAADNGPHSSVLSGAIESIAAMESKLKAKDVRFRRLRTSHAFHSSTADPILGIFTHQVSRVRRRPPQIPYLSNLTGTWIQPDQASSAEYWARHLRHTVRFRESLNQLQEIPNVLFLEVGPGQSLGVLVAQCPLAPVDIKASMRTAKEPAADTWKLMSTLGALWTAGVPIQWSDYWKHESRNRVPLPTYAFQRKRHWMEPAQEEQGPAPATRSGLQGTMEQQLATMMQQLQSIAQAGRQAAGEKSPLLPVQKWFFEQTPAEPHHFNHWIAVELRERLEIGQLRAAVKELVSTHDAFRTHYSKQASGWQAIIMPVSDAAATVEYVTVPALDAWETTFRQAREQANKRLDICSGPLLRIILFDAGPQTTQRLLIVCHHLLVDLFSWSIIMRDLEAACQQARQSSHIALPPVPCSSGAWVRRLKRYAQSAEAERELSYWSAGERRGVRSLPCDSTDGNNIERNAATWKAALEPGWTHTLLNAAPAFYGASISDILLTALSQAMTEWSGGPVAVDVEGHGREDLFNDLDLSRTVGWLTAIFPIVLDATAADDPETAVQRISKRRRDTRQGGIGFGLLRHLNDNPQVAAELSAVPPAQISFNYAEQQTPAAGALFIAQGECMGGSSSPENARRYLLEIEIAMRQERLSVGLRYCTEHHRRSTVEKLGNNILISLRKLAEHAGRRHKADTTPGMALAGAS